jgi:large repetitive protein
VQSTVTRAISAVAAALAAAAALTLAVGASAGTSNGQATVRGQAALASSVSCGETITTDTRLDRDLVNCPNNGIVIGADDVTLDLNGNVIDGDGIEFTACPPDEPCDIGVVDLDHHGVTIKGGTVQEFGVGVLVVGATDSRLARLAVANSLFFGVLVADSSGSEIDEVTASGNGLTTDQAGIVVFDSYELTIEKNAVFENGDIGFFIVGLDDSRIEGNSISRNPEAAMILEGSGNTLIRNRVSGNGDGLVVSGDTNTVFGNQVSDAVGGPDGNGFGISLEGGTGNVIEGNVVVRARQGDIRLASFEEFGGPPTVGNSVRGNLVRDSDVDGVLVESTAVDTLLEGNVAIGAGDDGIAVENVSTTLTRNLAVRNDDLGIEAVPGVTDGGGNKANANGNPAQCTNVSCS